MATRVTRDRGRDHPGPEPRGNSFLSVELLGQRRQGRQGGHGWRIGVAGSLGPAWLARLAFRVSCVSATPPTHNSSGPAPGSPDSGHSLLPGSNHGALCPHCAGLAWTLRELSPTTLVATPWSHRTRYPRHPRRRPSASASPARLDPTRHSEGLPAPRRQARVSRAAARCGPLRPHPDMRVAVVRTARSGASSVLRGPAWRPA